MKRIEALNGLSSFVYGLKMRLGDRDGLGGKPELDNADKKMILDTVKETTDWIDSYGQSATAEELEEKPSGVFIPIRNSCRSMVSDGYMQTYKVSSTLSRAHNLLIHFCFYLIIFRILLRVLIPVVIRSRSPTISPEPISTKRYHPTSSTSSSRERSRTIW